MPSESIQSLRPSPAPAVLVGTILMTAGYLLPWFRRSDSYEWSYSGWSYATLSNGGGWTNITFVFLLVSFVAAVWAGRSHAAAMWAVTAVVGAGSLALCVVAASFSNIPDRGYTNYLTDLPFGVGIPLLAAGFGLATASGVVALARTRQES